MYFTLSGTVRFNEQGKIIVRLNKSVYCSASSARRPNCLTPQTKTVLQTLTVPQLVKKFPAFHVTPSFIYIFNPTRHLSLSWARSIQCTALNHISLISVLILSSRLFKSSKCPPNLKAFLRRARINIYFPRKVRSLCHSCWFFSPDNIWYRSKQSSCFVKS